MFIVSIMQCHELVLNRCTCHFCFKSSQVTVRLKTPVLASHYCVYSPCRWVRPSRWRPSIKSAGRTLDIRSETQARLMSLQATLLFIVIIFLKPRLRDEAMKKHAGVSRPYPLRVLRRVWNVCWFLTFSKKYALIEIILNENERIIVGYNRGTVTQFSTGFKADITISFV